MKNYQKFIIGLFCLASSTAFAQFPDKQITMVIPYAPAGSTDVLGRILAQVMTKNLGQPVVVDNTAGAGGTIGAGRVARSKPDGYTILFHNMAQSSAPALYAKLAYDPVTDFAPIGMVTEVPMVLVARKNFPANTLQEFVAYVKANPGKLNFANAGVGATSNLCEALIKSSLSAEWSSISYKGTGPALNDMLAGQVDVICDQPASTLNHIKAGTLKAIAVATKDRISSLPDTPTFGQSGMTGFQLAVWHGMYAPAGTPKAVVDRLNVALNAALKDPQLSQKFNDMNAVLATPATANPGYLLNFTKSEIDRWKVAMKNAGVQPQ